MQACTCIAILRIIAKSELHNGFWGWQLCNKDFLCALYSIRREFSALAGIPLSPQGQEIMIFALHRSYFRCPIDALTSHIGHQRGNITASANDL